jgi:hypothetical protein
MRSRVQCSSDLADQLLRRETQILIRAGLRRLKPLFGKVYRAASLKLFGIIVRILGQLGLGKDVLESTFESRLGANGVKRITGYSPPGPAGTR